MANRTTIAVLTGLVVGALMGAGAVQYATITADILVARIDSVKRFPRDNGVIQQNPGIPDSRTEARTADTRTEKTVHGAATLGESARSCQKQFPSGPERADCLGKVIEDYQRFQ